MKYKRIKCIKNAHLTINGHFYYVLYCKFIYILYQNADFPLQVLHNLIRFMHFSGKLCRHCRRLLRN